MLNHYQNNTISSYRYGFNGYENENEVSGNGNHLSFEDFGYDPRVVRRWNIDPKAGQTPWQSPYIYAADNPIVNVDIDGEGDVTFDILINQKTGKSTFSTTGSISVFDKSNKVFYKLHYKNKDGKKSELSNNKKAFFSAFNGLSKAGKLYDKNGTKIESGKASESFKRSGIMFTNEFSQVAKKENDTKNVKSIDGQLEIGTVAIALNASATSPSNSGGFLNIAKFINNLVEIFKEYLPLSSDESSSSTTSTPKSDNGQNDGGKPTQTDSTYCGSCNKNVSVNDTSSHYLRPEE